MLPLDLTAFGNAAGWDRLPSNIAELNIQATAANPHFPGGLLPAVTEGGRIFCYAAVTNAAAWRRLRPLLLAYAGPTITTFSGIGRPPDLRSGTRATARGYRGLRPRTARPAAGGCASRFSSTTAPHQFARTYAGRCCAPPRLDRHTAFPLRHVSRDWGSRWSGTPVVDTT